ncbi:hypothetical protein CNYM01_07969 [Colletotrichum nymphaeae SA-01]|uniref:Uncharacterized protein n=1 Tax=Colletotrichum nymphaeae SA-01 TaxID=1460502 RepID=A0A135SH99_9PEZI|nr:hypothetical protein CNYM01_07969 [Colletotrichum nymphaeae SA-01]
MAPSKQSKCKLPEVPKVKQDAKIRKNKSARKNTSVKEHKSPKKGVKVATRPKNRALIQWRKEEPLLVTLLWVQFICAKDHGKMPWEDIIPQCFTGVTSTAFTQFLARERKRLLKMGYCVPPLPSQAKSLEKDANLRGYINEPTPENEDALIANAAGEEGSDGEAEGAVMEYQEDEDDLSRDEVPEKEGESSTNPFRQDPHQILSQCGHSLHGGEALHENSHLDQQDLELLLQQDQQFIQAQDVQTEVQPNTQADAEVQQQLLDQTQYPGQNIQMGQAGQSWPTQGHQLNGGTEIGTEMQRYMQAIEAWKNDAPPNEIRVHVEGLAPMAYYLIQVPESVSHRFNPVSSTDIMQPMRNENGYTTFSIQIPVNLDGYLDGVNSQEADPSFVHIGDPSPANLPLGTSSLNDPAWESWNGGLSDGVNGRFQGGHYQHDSFNRHVRAIDSNHVGYEQGVGSNDINSTAMGPDIIHEMMNEL